MLWITVRAVAGIVLTLLGRQHLLARTVFYLVAACFCRLFALCLHQARPWTLVFAGIAVLACFASPHLSFATNAPLPAGMLACLCSLFLSAEKREMFSVHQQSFRLATGPGLPTAWLAFSAAFPGAFTGGLASRPLL